MAGRIKDSERPLIDFATLAPATELEFVPAIRKSGTDFPELIRNLVDRAVTRRKIQVQPVPDADQGEEFGRLCRAYGRVHEPQLTVKTSVHMTGEGVVVHVQAAVRNMRKLPVNAPVTDPNDAQTGVQTVSTPKHTKVPEPTF
jgi:hypothetical protein